MTADQPYQVVIAAGGLGTRVHAWARHLPKEFQPIDGRPGITHILDEIALLGPVHVVVVHHPYYEDFAAWARYTFSPHGYARYQRAAGLSLPCSARVSDLSIEFIPQDGPYADLTSVTNAADHFASASALYIAFGDNIYPDSHPLLDLSECPGGTTAVYARPYRADLASGRGVIITRGEGASRAVLDVIEKPDRIRAERLEREHGQANLFLLEGRMRLTADFVDYARCYRAPRDTEPKLALAIRAYAQDHEVVVVAADGRVVDLGTPVRRVGRSVVFEGVELGGGHGGVALFGVFGVAEGDAFGGMGGYRGQDEVAWVMVWWPLFCTVRVGVWGVGVV